MPFTLRHKNVPSPLNCWKGFSRVPGTEKGAKGSCKKSPLNKQKGGGTTKTCLPASKIKSLSSEKKEELVNSKDLVKQMLKVLVKKELLLETGLKKKTGEELMIQVKNVENKNKK